MCVPGDPNPIRNFSTISLDNFNFQRTNTFTTAGT